MVVVVEAADVGGQPDEADEAVLVAVEGSNLKIWKMTRLLNVEDRLCHQSKKGKVNQCNPMIFDETLKECLTKVIENRWK